MFILAWNCHIPVMYSASKNLPTFIKTLTYFKIFISILDFVICLPFLTFLSWKNFTAPFNNTSATSNVYTAHPVNFYSAIASEILNSNDPSYDCNVLLIYSLIQSFIIYLFLLHKSLKPTTFLLSTIHPLLIDFHIPPKFFNLSFNHFCVIILKPIAYIPMYW